jgi:hypothetical protein
MLQLENKTPFAANMALFPNEHGVDTLYVIVKASFNIGDKWTLLEKQSPPVEADIYYGEPESSSLQYASDYHVGKPSTDIIMNGLACAPDKQEVTQMDVQLQVGNLGKKIRVFGSRQWDQGRITAPQPFTTMPMVYEKSYGGMHIIDGEIDSSEKRNPIGVGYSGNRSASEMTGVFLPNLEDPDNLIRTFDDAPNPACFGFLCPGWEPRVKYVGTYDELWQTERAPYLPEDFDKRFFNIAHPDLVATGYLKGGEDVFISGMHPDGNINFKLPSVSLGAAVHIANKEHSSPFNLETVLLEPNKLQLSMVWRAAYTCDKKALKIKSIKVSLKR